MPTIFQRFCAIEQEKPTSSKIALFADTSFDELNKMELDGLTLNQIMSIHSKMMAQGAAQPLVQMMDFKRYPPKQTIRKAQPGFVFFFVHFLRCISVVSARMFEPTVPVHIHAFILLIPLIELFEEQKDDAYIATIGYQGLEAIPENIHDFVRKQSECASEKTRSWTSKCASWLSEEKTPPWHKSCFEYNESFGNFMYALTRNHVREEARSVRELLGFSVLPTIVMLVEPEKTLTVYGMIRRISEWISGFNHDEVNEILESLKALTGGAVENRMGLLAEYQLDLNNLEPYRNDLAAAKQRIDEIPRSHAQFEAEAILETALLRLAKLEVGKMILEAIIRKKTFVQITVIPPNMPFISPSFTQADMVHEPIVMDPIMTSSFLHPYMQPSFTLSTTTTVMAQEPTQQTISQAHNSQNYEPPEKKPRQSVTPPQGPLPTHHLSLPSHHNLAFTVPENSSSPFALSDLLTATRNLMIEGSWYD